MIPLFKVFMADSAAARVADVLASGHIAQGPIVDKFEAELASVIGCSPGHIVTTNSGTSAIHLALALADVGPGDVVAVSPMTCAATIAPILHLGAVPLWIDVDPLTGNMDPASLDWRLTTDTKAIVAIDWAGRPCAYEAIRKVDGSIPLIVDAAHSFLAAESPISSRAHGWLIDEPTTFVAHSFQAIKHLTTGDGGALLVPKVLAERARKLRWFGFDRTSGKDFRCAQELTEAGYKFHMNDIAAAIGRANLVGVRARVQAHRENACFYHEHFGALGPRVRIPPWDAGSAWWLYTLLVDDRAKFQAFMAERGIETSQVHRRNDEHPVFKHAAKRQIRKLEGLDLFAASQVSIPVNWSLTAGECMQIVEAVMDYVKS